MSVAVSPAYVEFTEPTLTIEDFIPTLKWFQSTIEMFNKHMETHPDKFNKFVAEQREHMLAVQRQFHSYLSDLDRGNVLREFMETPAPPISEEEFKTATE